MEGYNISSLEMKLEETEKIKIEERYRLITENTSDLISINTFSLNPMYTYVSPSFKKILGYEPEEMIGKNNFDFIHPDDIKNLLPLLKKYLYSKAKKLITGKESEIVEKFECRLRDKWGTYHYVESTGNIIGKEMLFVTKDITEKKRIEEELKESNDRLMKLFNNSQVGIVICKLMKDEHGKPMDYVHIAVNPSTEKHLGHSPETLLNKTATDLIGKEAGTIYAQRNGSCALTGKPYSWIDYVPIYNRCLKMDSYHIKDDLFVINFEDITEKKNADNKLKESEEKYRNLIEASQDSIYILDPELRHLLVNDSGTKFVNMTREQLLGNKLTDLFPGFEKTLFYKTFKKVLKSKKPDHVVNRFVFPDGNVGYYDVSISPIKEGILCISRDISELKQSEEKLSESEKKYRNYLESAPDGVFVCDNDGTYLEVNEAAARITGYSKDELITHSIRDMIPDDSVKESYAHFNRLKKVGKSDGTLKFKRKDGSIGYWNVSAVSLTENTYMGFVKDVTDQIKTQKVLRESEEKYRGVVDNIGIGVSLISKDMEILFLNNKMQTWYPDISSDEKSICYKVYNNPPQDGPCSYCPTILTLKDGKIHESITQTLTPHGIINYRIVSSPIFKEDATVDMAIEIVEDITIMKQAEEKLIQMNKELDEKVKERTQTIEKILKQKDEFVNQLGHDLKNPLGPLLNLIPILEKKETNQEKKEMLNVMNRNVAFMKNLITKTIQLAQLNSPNIKFTIEKLNLTDILDDILSNNKMLCEKSHIQLVNNITKDIFVQGDTTHLQEVFNNLISNAVKYTKGSGTITIDSKRSRNDDIIISIKDTGIGLTPDQTQKVFDEFYKVNHENHDFESSGLGMTITKRIIERHGGKIWVESAGIGKGCTFYFSLPLSTESDKNVTSLLTEIQPR